MHNIVVTGGSRGIGLEIGRVLADNGYHVIAVARSEGSALRAAIEHAPGRISFHRADLSDVPGLADTAQAIRAQFGGVYGLVNNAGIGTSGILSNMPDSAIDDLVRLNVVSPMTLTKYLTRPMLVARMGRVINLSSVVASTGYGGLSVYSGTKAAMIGFTRSLARELGPLGITVNAVAPGFIETDMTDTLNQKQREQIKRRSALGRMPTARDVAETVAFLVSDRAANITGTVMTVDAGNTA